MITIRRALTDGSPESVEEFERVGQLVYIADETALFLRHHRLTAKAQEEMLTRDWSEAWELVGDKDDIHFVAADGDLILGYGTCLGGHRGSEAGDLLGIHVHPNWRRCGLGRRLLRAIEDEAMSLGFLPRPDFEQWDEVSELFYWVSQLRNSKERYVEWS